MPSTPDNSVAKPVWMLRMNIAHHSPHSGYDRLADYVANARSLPKIRIGPAYRLLRAWYDRRLGRRCPLGWYGMSQFLVELDVMARSAMSHEAVFHYLYGESQYWMLGRMKPIRGARLVASFHQPPEMLRDFVKDRSHLQRLDAVVVMSDTQRPFFEEVMGEKRVHTVPHGVDCEFFKPLESRPAWQRPTCLFGGSWLRDFQTLHRVADSLARTEPDVHLYVVTSMEKRPYLAGCDNVTLLSGISETRLLELYQTVDLMILPMEHSTANNVLLEGLACGTPVVATDVGGVREYMDESCGALAPARDAAAFTDTVRRLLRDETGLRAMRLAARARAELFDWRLIARRMAPIYAQAAPWPGGTDSV